ncbi:hypothetical protein FUAX_49040 (plasmid) [Fulvitalea axinellae]|uniref:Uncharacterized protein n=1 Tax=Fulvitalea axinellae TaxID=1182444 RepID=A0AAU9D4T9_9BACT|nr:hypothetical protein FUAX_49040 [Fulvitalea axinellae]
MFKGAGRQAKKTETETANKTGGVGGVSKGKGFVMPPPVQCMITKEQFFEELDKHGASGSKGASPGSGASTPISLRRDVEGSKIKLEHLTVDFVNPKHGKEELEYEMLSVPEVEDFRSALDFDKKGLEYAEAEEAQIRERIRELEEEKEAYKEAFKVLEAEAERLEGEMKRVKDSYIEKLVNPAYKYNNAIQNIETCLGDLADLYDTLGGILMDKEAFDHETGDDTKYSEIVDCEAAVRHDIAEKEAQLRKLRTGDTGVAALHKGLMSVVDTEYGGWYKLQDGLENAVGPVEQKRIAHISTNEYRTGFRNKVALARLSPGKGQKGLLDDAKLRVMLRKRRLVGLERERELQDQVLCRSTKKIGRKDRTSETVTEIGRLLGKYHTLPEEKDIRLRPSEEYQKLEAEGNAIDEERMEMSTRGESLRQDLEEYEMNIEGLSTACTSISEGSAPAFAEVSRKGKVSGEDTKKYYKWASQLTEDRAYKRGLTGELEGKEGAERQEAESKYRTKFDAEVYPGLDYDTEAVEEEVARFRTKKTDHERELAEMHKRERELSRQGVELEALKEKASGIRYVPNPETLVDDDDSIWSFRNEVNLEKQYVKEWEELQASFAEHTVPGLFEEFTKKLDAPYDEKAHKGKWNKFRESKLYDERLRFHREFHERMDEDSENSLGVTPVIRERRVDTRAKQFRLHNGLSLLHTIERLVFRWYSEHPVTEMGASHPFTPVMMGVLRNVRLEQQGLIKELSEFRLPIWSPDRARMSDETKAHFDDQWQDLAIGRTGIKTIGALGTTTSEFDYGTMSMFASLMTTETGRWLIDKFREKGSNGFKKLATVNRVDDSDPLRRIWTGDMHWVRGARKGQDRGCSESLQNTPTDSGYCQVNVPDKMTDSSVSYYTEGGRGRMGFGQKSVFQVLSPGFIQFGRSIFEALVENCKAKEMKEFARFFNDANAFRYFMEMQEYIEEQLMSANIGEAERSKATLANNGYYNLLFVGFENELRKEHGLMARGVANVRYNTAFGEL